MDDIREGIAGGGGGADDACGNIREGKVGGESTKEGRGFVDSRDETGYIRSQCM